MTAPPPSSAAGAFYERGRELAAAGDSDNAIELFLRGLALDPDNLECHQELRDIALKRKAGGGKPLGMFARMKTKTTTKDDKTNMLAAEKLLAYDPGCTDYMLRVLEAALRIGCDRTAVWMRRILQKAIDDSPKPRWPWGSGE
jgi:tetratricopeptide (TPR) repeat protein